MSKAADNNLAPSDKEKIRFLTEKLKEIEEFGKNNPGFGYSCSEMAKESLSDLENLRGYLCGYPVFSDDSVCKDIPLDITFDEGIF